MPRRRARFATEKQLEVYLYLIEYICEHGYQPCRKEMADHFGVYMNAINGRLKELHKKGIIVLPGAGQERAIGLRSITFTPVPQINVPEPDEAPQPVDEMASISVVVGPAGVVTSLAGDSHP
jgi:SOS-response transcriptional repressor LexA